MKNRIIHSNDGSHTLFVPDMNEHYHSTHGAIQESEHVFIRAGLEYKAHKELCVFEIGFGTGLNALLSYYFAKKYNIVISYYSIEAFPVESSIIKLLNYPEMINENDAREVFRQMHEIPWNKETAISSFFSLKKIHDRIESFQYPENIADIIYFDAFAPVKQPELWTIEIFKKMYGLLKNRGILVTYSAKGQVKRNMKEAGFTVETLPGPPGKREMTRGSK